MNNDIYLALVHKELSVHVQECKRKKRLETEEHGEDVGLRCYYWGRLW